MGDVGQNLRPRAVKRNGIPALCLPNDTILQRNSWFCLPAATSTHHDMSSVQQHSTVWTVHRIFVKNVYRVLYRLSSVECFLISCPYHYYLLCVTDHII